MHLEAGLSHSPRGCLYIQRNNIGKPDLCSSLEKTQSIRPVTATIFKDLLPPYQIELVNLRHLRIGNFLIERELGGNLPASTILIAQFQNSLPPLWNTFSIFPRYSSSQALSLG